MAELSMLWNTTGTGDGPSGGYTMADWNRYFQTLMLSVAGATGAVLEGVGNELACTGSATPIAVNTGAAVVYGYLYNNTASVNLAVSSPAVGLTGGHVVLRASWAAQTVRLVAVRNTDGVAAIPALTQVAGTTYEIRLCSFTITTGGVITITDTRAFNAAATQVLTAMIVDSAVTTAKLADLAVSTAKLADLAVTAAKLAASAVTAGKIATGGVSAAAQFAAGVVDNAAIAALAVDDAKIGNRVATVTRFQGSVGSGGTTWGLSPGTTNYTIGGKILVQLGFIDPGSTGSVTFPTAFSALPLVFLQSFSSDRHPTVTSCSSTTFNFRNTDMAGTLAFGQFAWLAIGMVP